VRVRVCESVSLICSIAACVCMSVRVGRVCECESVRECEFHMQHCGVCVYGCASRASM